MLWVEKQLILSAHYLPLASLSTLHVYNSHNLYEVGTITDEKTETQVK